MVNIKSVLDYNDIEQINKIINIMERHFRLNHTAIHYELFQDYADIDVDIIDKYPDIFYKCTLKTTLLVVWIFEGIDKLFSKCYDNKLKLSFIYDKLRMQFGVYSMNYANLSKLLNSFDVLMYDDFIKLYDKYSNIYNNPFTLFTADRVEEDKRNEIPTNIKIIANEIFENVIYPEVIEMPNIRYIDMNDSEKKKYIMFLSAKGALGAELCTNFLKNMELTAYIYDISVDLFYELREEIKQYNTYLYLFNEINPNNMNCKITPLIEAFFSDEIHKNIMMEILSESQIQKVKEIVRVLSGLAKHKDLPIASFLKWLHQDKKELLYKEFTKIFKNERNEKIFKNRAAGYTLEMAGSEFGITRERVRQIETKYIRSFNSYMARIKPVKILSAFCDDINILDTKTISSIYGEYDYVFIYALKLSNSRSSGIWNEDLNCFVLGDSTWLNAVEGYIDNLPAVIEANQMDNVILKMKESLDIPVELDIKRIISKSYKLVGNTYSKNRLNRIDMYLMVIEKHFPNGIKLYDDLEMMRFKNYYIEMFKDVELPDTDRAIAARLADKLILCDRGKYILPSQVNFDEPIFDEIFNYIINSNKNTILYHELFEVFKAELLNIGIDNRYYLHGALKYKYSNKLGFRRDAVSKDMEALISVKDEIEQYIFDKGGVVTKDEIRQVFPGITDATLLNSIASNKEILLWGTGEYIHSSRLVIDDDTIKRLKDLLKNYTASGTVSVQKAYDEIYLAESEVFIANQIDNHTAFFSLLYYLFEDEFEFKRPFISAKDKNIEDLTDIVREYIGGFNEITITDLKDYLDNMHLKIINFSMLLDDLSDEFIRVDENLLYRRELLNLSDEIVESVEETTLALMENKGYISVKNITDFTFYPYLGTKWTPFLLVSIIKALGKKIKIIDFNTDYRYNNSIFVDKRTDIVEYEQLLYYAIKNESERYSFKDINDIQNFLRGQGLISNSLPDSLLESIDGLEGIRMV